MRSTLYIFLYLLATVIGVSCTVDNADIILTNGKIFTSDSSQLYVQALAVKDNRILAIGNTETILRLASPKTRIIDLLGKTVIPGINDAHDHLGWQSPVGLTFSYPQNDPVGLSKHAVLDSVARLVKRAKPNQWISGWIGTQILFDTTMRKSLDSVAMDHPVVLQAWWGHGQVVNAKALSISGLSDQDPDPLGGRYVRATPQGPITAVHENAQVPVWNTWLSSERENQLSAMRAYSLRQLKSGVTTVQQMSSTFSSTESERLFEEANLAQRVRVIAWPRTSVTGRSISEWKLDREKQNLIYYSGIKYMMDGTPLEQNSLWTKPYPGRDNWHGVLNYPVDTIRQILEEALSGERQLMMHITGDSTMSVVLTLMKQMAGAEVWKSKRVRIEHNSISQLDMEAIADVKALGLLVMHTPVYNQRSAIRSLVDAGIVVGIAPDGMMNPFWNMMVITSQQAVQTENISIEQAVIAYTRTNAFAEFQEKSKGTLLPGMLADLIVLSQDIFITPSERLPATVSVLTMVDGKIVYQENGL